MPLNSLADAIRVSREYISEKKIYEVFYQGIKDLTENLKIIKKNKPIKQKDSDKTSITIGLFDLHFGQKVELIDSETNKKVVMFDNDIAVKLLDDVFDQANMIIAAFKNNLGEINIVLGGDIIEGDGAIFPGQIHEMASGINEQLQVATQEIVKHIISISKSYKVPINVYSIVGNHGEIRGSVPKKLRDNYDAIIGRYIAFALDQVRKYTKGLKNVNMFVSEDSLSVYVQTINGHKIEVIHELPRNLMSPKSEQIILSRRIGWDVDLIFTGHYHSPLYHEVGDVKVVRSGSLVGPNQYSHKLGIPPGSRQQTLIISTKDDVAKYIINIKPTLKEHK